MKKTLALILSLLMLAVPSFALELDVAEGADVAVVEAEANLSAGPEVPASVAKYDATYGELIYFEDFEDNTVVSYTNGASASISGMAKFGQEANGNRYGIGQANMYPSVTDPVHPVGSKLTVKADLMLMEGATSTNVHMWGYGTQEMWPAISASDATTTAWVTKAKTLNGTSALNGGKQLIYLGNNANFYWDNIAIYAKYDMASDKIRLVEGTDYSHVALTEQTYTFPAPADTAFDGWISADGTVYEAGKTVNASEIGGKTFNSYKVPVYAEKPAEITADGMLVYFDNFSGNTGFTNIGDFEIDGLSTDLIAEGGRFAVKGTNADLPDNSLTGIMVKAADGESYKFTDGRVMNGTLKIMYSIYNNSPESYPYYRCSNGANDGDGWGGYKTNWNSQSAVANSWSDHSVSMSTNGRTAIGRLNSHGRSGYVYFSSVAVYYMPTNYVKLTIDGETEMVDLGTATTWTATVPVEGYNAWKANNTKYYFEGDAVPAGVTLVPANLETTNESLGELIWFNDFEYGTDGKTPAYANSDWDFSASWFNVSDAKLITRDGRTCFMGNFYWQGGYILSVNNNTGVPGYYTYVVDYYINSEETVEPRDSAWMTFNCDSKGNGGSQVWPTKVGMDKWGTMQQRFTAQNGITSAMFRSGNGNGNSMYYHIDSIKLYFKPCAKVTLVEDGVSATHNIFSDTEYTFPATSDAFNAWADEDGNVYKAGTKVTVATVNGKTFTAVYDASEYAPKAAGVEMRLTANTAKNGIRFKAALAPSKKAEANEAGFIVARAEVLEKIGQDLTFDLSYEGVANAEGTLFVKGVAYNKAEGKNIVADILADGSEVYTGVCVGMNIENKVHVTSTLVARPYVKLDVAGNEITVYGAEQSASLYELVSAVKETEAYEGAKQYIDTVIATAEAN